MLPLGRLAMMGSCRKGIRTFDGWYCIAAPVLSAGCRAGEVMRAPGFAIKAQIESERAMQHNQPKEPALPPRAWQRMLSGRRLDLLDPSPLDIEIGDIAHGLARLARWNGQTKGAHALSVAQHCVLVEDIAAALKPELSGKFRLAALLHDAPEYVVGDLISPFKAAMAAVYKPFEERIQRAIHVRFGLPPELPPGVAQLIKKADKIAAYYEATQLAGFTLADAKQFFGHPGQLNATMPESVEKIEPLDTAAAQAAYLARFAALRRRKRRDGRARRAIGSCAGWCNEQASLPSPCPSPPGRGDAFSAAATCPLSHGERVGVRGVTPALAAVG